MTIPLNLAAFLIRKASIVGQVGDSYVLTFRHTTTILIVRVRR